MKGPGIEMWEKSKCWRKGMMGVIIIVMIFLFVMLMHTISSFAGNTNSVQTSGRQSDTEANLVITAPTPILTGNKSLTSLKKEYEVCQTEECKRTAASLGIAMDLSVDPCEDFYKFSCGNWISKMKSSSNGSSTNQFQQLRTKTRGKLIEMTEAVNENDNEPLKQFKNLYDSCIKAASTPNGFQLNGTEPNKSANLAEELIQIGDMSRNKQLVCFIVTFSLMPLPMELKYGLKYVDKDKLDEARKLVTAIKASFQRLLSRLEWMDDETKESEVLRSDLLLTLLGYPESLRNSPEFVEDYYKMLKFDKSSFPLNMVAFSRWKSSRKLVQDPIEIQILRGSKIPTLEVNALYLGNYNALVIPDVIMQEPVFGTGLKATDYGGLGMVVGHEMMHGFNMAAGSVNLVFPESDSWSSTARTIVLNRSDCFVKQYENYQLPELDVKSGKPNRINGTLTLDENLADNAGLQLAYDAYKDYVREQKEPEPRLPGQLEAYSPEQLFFLSFAHSWCAYENPTDLKESIAKEGHSPYMYRVIGALSNFDEFSNVWKCPPTSKMNPENKCVV